MQSRHFHWLSVSALLFALGPSLASARDPVDDLSGHTAKRPVAAPEAQPGKCYRLTEGHRFPLCRAYVNDLNRFCEDSALRCDFKVHPDYARDLARPAWEDVDPREHVGLIAQWAQSYFSVPSECKNECERERREKNWQEFKVKFDDALNAGRVRLQRARVDLNYDGIKELVYRLGDQECHVDHRVTFMPGQTPTLMVAEGADERLALDYAQTLNQKGSDIVLLQGRAHLYRGNLYEGLTGPGIGRYAANFTPVCQVENLR